jgi:AmmeMemoRadiSam system protein A
MLLTEKDKLTLLKAARDSIGSVFGEGLPPEVDYNSSPELKLRSGAFVTLRINEQLRGCIGYIYSKLTLFDTVCDAAKQAAFNDPRFPPLSPEELNKIKIEISVLSVPVTISNYDEIKLGIHGLLLEEGMNRSVLLPQVATENNYGLEEFLTILCEKAGLYSQLWKLKTINLKTFEAVIFSEEELIGKEYEKN